VAAIVVGILLIAVAVVYWIDTANALPSFFPGHQAGSSTKHVKHGIAALVVGLGFLVVAWFASGPAARRRA
jgi:hypothetical protein